MNRRYQLELHNLADGFSAGSVDSGLGGLERFSGY